MNADILHQAGEDCGKRRVRRAGDFPGGPVVKTLHFHCRGHGSNPLVGELRSHMPSGVTKKKKGKNQDFCLGQAISEVPGGTR